MSKYEFDAQGRFVIENYNRAKTFSSFLPGVAGIMGIPMWLFYVNRGQAVASFGIRDKDGAIMEFFPAHRSYQLVPVQGFRTFIKLNGGKAVFEPFSCSDGDSRAEERMFISSNVLELESLDRRRDISVKITYFTVPNESFAALARIVEITNLAENPVDFEVIDGMPAVFPYGLSNGAYKELGTTLKAWMDVFNLENGIPFYKLRSSTADTAEVTEITGGHFMLSFVGKGTSGELLKPIVDADLVFGSNTSLIKPDNFLSASLDVILSTGQVTTNKVPCGFTGYSGKLGGGASVTLCSLIGHTAKIESINRRAAELAKSSYIEEKLRDARELTANLTSCVETHTASPEFDSYCRQNYLDNVLRGGHPILLDGGNGRDPFVYHVYSRKHGDLERDYNYFTLLPSYYSQGNGAFRDVNQNRRNDVLIHPEVKDFNIRMFMSLIQPDGYNPLVVKGCSFKVEEPGSLLGYVAPDHRDAVASFLTNPYTPGELLAFIENNGIGLTVPAEEFLGMILGTSEQLFEADFGEGYWIDHWTYNMDLIEAYLSIYPDKVDSLLFGSKDYGYYDSPAFVRPRHEKYVLTKGGVRQYGAVSESKEKERLLGSRSTKRSWVRTEHGKGAIYKTDLFTKLVNLALVKFATMDPEGLGIEMEANKPGWNDSLNGLPGLFASGFGELCELKRLLKFIIAVQTSEGDLISLPVEAADLLEAAEGSLERLNSSSEADREFVYWDEVAAAREQYRSRVLFGFGGEERSLPIAGLVKTLSKFLAKVDGGIRRAYEIGKGVYPMYFYYEAVRWEPLADEAGNPIVNEKGLPLVRATEFRRRDLPHFLEGSVRALKITGDVEARRTLYRNIRNSSLFDGKLKMYKVNEPLQNETMEIGRSRAFTPGWLENESVFLHMEYKYLLEMLKGGLYQEFFDDMKTALIPFHDPEAYGRSTLENSSFIASSANPDKSLHGRGFVARLTGSTAEMLSIWNLMMAGKKPFSVIDGNLCLTLAPVLPSWLFTEEGTVRFRFLNNCLVSYINRGRKDTFGEGAATIRKMKLSLTDGKVVEIEGAVVPEPWASMMRDKQVAALEAYME